VRGGEGSAPAAIDCAFNRIYNFDFPRAFSTLDKLEHKDPSYPVTYSVHAAAMLFSEIVPITDSRNGVLRQRREGHWHQVGIRSSARRYGVLPMAESVRGSASGIKIQFADRDGALHILR
jgi:hypothetical protein